MEELNGETVDARTEPARIGYPRAVTMDGNDDGSTRPPAAESPFRARRLASAEVHRIVRRAAELALESGGGGGAEQSLTREEVERLCVELGLPEEAIRRAIAGDAGDAGGAPTTLDRRGIVFEDEIDGELSPSRHDDVVDAIQAAAGEPGRTQFLGRTLTWTPAPAIGYPRQLTVSVQARDGRTRVHIEENLSQTSTALYLGVMCLLLAFGLLVAIALVVDSAAISLLTWIGLGVGLALVMLAGAAIVRFATRSIRRRRMQVLTAMRARLGSVVREGIAARPAGARVRIGARDAAAAKEEAAKEEAAEEEAAAQDRARAR